MITASASNCFEFTRGAMMFMLKCVPCLTCSFISFVSRVYFSSSRSVRKCVVVPSPMLLMLWILIWVVKFFVFNFGFKSFKVAYANGYFVNLVVKFNYVFKCSVGICGIFFGALLRLSVGIHL